MKKPPYNNYEGLPSLKTCTGCMACVDVCPRNALSPYLHKSGHYIVKANRESCINCGQCIQICSVLRVENQNPSSDLESCYAAWHNDLKTRKESTSGGVFAGLAQVFIQHGGCVWGVALDQMKTQHICIDKIESISRLQGSKYLQENIAGTYRKVISQLKGKKSVLFSGLPCQCAALKSIAHKNNLEDNLYTVDLICGGVSSLLPLQIFLKNRKDVSSIVSFRDKDDGWKPIGYHYKLKTRNHNGIIHDEGNINPITRGYFCKYLYRPSCNYCIFSKRFNRKADLTIGDFWGYKDFPEEHFNGVSSVIVHSEKGKSLLHLADITLHAVKIENIIEHNRRFLCEERTIQNGWIKRALNILWFKYMLLYGNQGVVFKILKKLAQ